MGDVYNFSVQFRLDDQGFLGRECPKCEMYFKVKPGTGLPIDYHICPYCNYKGSNNEFFTKEQIEYAKSIALKQTIEPLLDEFGNSLKKLETSTRGGFVQFKVSWDRNPIRIQYYQEKDLETDVTCDSCGLVFSIYGVFSNCPDCGRLNAKVIFEKSIESSRKKLGLSIQEGIANELKEELMKDALLSAISSFDSLGKVLRDKHPSKFPMSPKNLFQNIIELDRILKASFGKEIKDFLSFQGSEFLLRMFQVRHIYEHNAGVVDDDFIKKIPALISLKGRKYNLEKQEIDSFLETILELGRQIYSQVE
jgi:hypothetical protein